VGAFVATFLGQAVGWSRPGEGAGLTEAVVGTIIVLLMYGMITNLLRERLNPNKRTQVDVSKPFDLHQSPGYRYPSVAAAEKIALWETDSGLA